MIWRLLRSDLVARTRPGGYTKGQPNGKCLQRSMRIDAHQHFWNYEPAEYPWMTERLASIRQNFLPVDLERAQAKIGLNGSIAVQARQSLKESRWLLELADRHPLIHGVVGWVDLQSDEVERQLAEFAPHPKFVGVRHVVQDEPDDNFMLRPAFLDRKSVV